MDPFTEMLPNSHTVLIRSDGTAVACGSNVNGQCDIAPLDNMGIKYVHAAAGYSHTVLLRSDGTVVACGSNFDGECNIPLNNEGITFVRALSRITLQATYDGTSMSLWTLGGRPVCKTLMLRETCPAPRQVASNANGCNKAAEEVDLGHAYLFSDMLRAPECLCRSEQTNQKG